MLVSLFVRVVVCFALRVAALRAFCLQGPISPGITATNHTCCGSPDEFAIDIECLCVWLYRFMYLCQVCDAARDCLLVVILRRFLPFHPKFSPPLLFGTCFSLPYDQARVGGYVPPHLRARQAAQAAQAAAAPPAAPTARDSAQDARAPGAAPGAGGGGGGGRFAPPPPASFGARDVRGGDFGAAGGMLEVSIVVVFSWEIDFTHRTCEFYD
jgi:hypothetical protein